MAVPDPIDGGRTEALRLLAEFHARILPGALRRIATWKGVSDAALLELREDVRQELALDCVAAAAEIVTLPRHQRHARWMRLVERWVYRQVVRSARRHTSQDPDALPARADTPNGDHCAAPHLVRMKNGRCNLTATARRFGGDVDAVRRELRRLARELGHDAETDRFWQRRLAEALTGLAADLLRQGARLYCLPPDGPGPDPAARLGRVRKLGARIPVHCTSAGLRRLLARCRHQAVDPAPPRALLEQAVRLAPERPEGWLWLFEAAVAEGELAAAAAALRRCRRGGRYRGSVLLARARLLEARGRWHAARALLTRAVERWPREPTLRAASAVVNGPARARAPARRRGPAR